MIKSNFLKKVHTAAKFLQNLNNFRANLEPLKKTDILMLFQNTYHNPIPSSPSLAILTS